VRGSRRVNWSEAVDTDCTETHDGMVDSIPGEVANLAISRPSSPMQPCISMSSSHISFTVPSREDNSYLHLHHPPFHSPSQPTIARHRSCAPTMCKRVQHFSSFLKHRAMMRSVPGISSEPWSVKLCKERSGSLDGERDGDALWPSRRRGLGARETG
jgi:hypothetical protein